MESNSGEKDGEEDLIREVDHEAEGAAETPKARRSFREWVERGKVIARVRLSTRPKLQKRGE